MSKIKSDLLGTAFGTANARLRKSIMFELARKADMLRCFQCGELIETVDDFSIEHKEPWQSADDPVAAFFSLENIAFSHYLCNVLAAKSRRVYPDERERKRLGFLRYYDRHKDAVLLRKRQRYARKRSIQTS